MAVKVKYDAEIDVLRIILNEEPVEESDESRPGVILDYGRNGNVVGLEVLDASKCVEDPTSVECALER